MRKSNWSGLGAFKEKVLRDIYQQNKTVKFDKFQQTDKAWIIQVSDKQYILPKSKTILFHNDNTIQMPMWLYNKKFK